MTQQFNLSDRDLLISDETIRLRKVLEKNVAATFGVVSELDAPPKVLYRMRPVYPPDIREAGGVGEATVEFIIDRQGLPQLPRLVSATNPEFGWAAMTAIREWRFQPLSRKGKPVEIRVRQSMKFNLNDEAKD